MTLSFTPISYDHGVSDRKLLGETIGAFFDRAVETWRDREALVVGHQACAGPGASWPPRRRSGRRPAVAGAGTGRPGRHLGAQPRGMGADAVRHRKAGLVLVNVNPAYRRSELEYALNKVECKALVLAPALKTSTTWRSSTTW